MATPGNLGAAGSEVFRGIVAEFLWLIFSSRIPGFPALQAQTEIKRGFEVVIRMAQEILLLMMITRKGILLPQFHKKKERGGQNPDVGQRAETRERRVERMKETRKKRK